MFCRKQQITKKGFSWVFTKRVTFSFPYFILLKVFVAVPFNSTFKTSLNLEKDILKNCLHNSLIIYLILSKLQTTICDLPSSSTYDDKSF